MSSTPLVSDFIEASIAFSDEERRLGIPSNEHIALALELFQTHGFIRLENVFSPEAMQRWDKHYRRRYSAYLEDTDKEDRRPLFTVDVEGPFNSPEFYANPLVMPFIEATVGKQCIVAAMSSVASFPGAPDQFVHRDSRAIFGDDYEIDRHIPTYSLTMLVPFVDCTRETGCTKVWPGSHMRNDAREAETVAPLEPLVRVGSVLITNSKLIHRGGANVSQTLRPLVYLTYHRQWFRDFWGYESRPPVNVSAAQLRRVPEEHRHMFNWTKDAYAWLRIKNAFNRVAPFRFMRRI